MSIFEAFRMAIQNILASKMRTFLTMLGIVIGIMAVTVIVGLGNGMQEYMVNSFGELGTNSLNVTLIGRGSTRKASVDDLYEIQKENSAILNHVSPVVSMKASVKIGRDTCKSTSVSGVSEDYFEMKDYYILRGRGLQYMDIAERRNVVVVGSYLDQAYYAGNAVGDTLKLNGTKYTIVGVMEQETETMEEGGTDDCVFLPYSTAARVNRMGTINSYLFTVTSEDYSSQGRKIIEDGLYEIYGDNDAYFVMSMAEILDMMTDMVDVMITILAAIAAISLVVGGVGIMNIMLVSVSERTREIGIRKALGAKERYIMEQFVIEAALTSALGGVIGIALGYVSASVATVLIVQFMEVEMAVTPSAGSVLLAFMISVGIGILFGYLPAKKAAVLNPIDALRYE